MRGRSTPAPLGYRVLAAVVGVLVRLAGWRLTIRDASRVPAAGGAVLTWNHASHLDMVVTALLLWQRTGRWVRLLAVRELWGHPLLWWVPRVVRCVPVDRTSPDGREAAFTEAVDAVAAGDLVMVAPEGTISPTGALLPFRTGAVRIARAAGVPIVPTASWGTQGLVTPDRRFVMRRAWRVTVAVHVGEPLVVGPDQHVEVATDELRQHTHRLLTAARAERQRLTG